jgi:hypothetical protein
MSDRFAPDFNDLEAQLADLAGALAFPPTPDLATAVRTRLRAGAQIASSETRVVPFRRSLRRSLLLAAALTLLVVGGALAIRYGLELLDIRFGPVPTMTPTPSVAGPSPGTSVALGASLRLGEPATLQDVLGISAFRVLVPERLGPPDMVYVGGAALRGQVAFVYAVRDTLPMSGLLGGAGGLITQTRGELDQGLVDKLLNAELATVERVEVSGAPGVWIAGGPHVFWYLAPDGTVIEESRRFVGNTLAWERDGVLYRIESMLDLDGALEIARSMR